MPTVLTTAGRRQQRVERAVLRMARGRRSTWRGSANKPSWFDAPDAHDQIGSRTSDPIERDYLEQWIDKGCFVADGLISDAVIDGVNEAMDRLWTTATAVPGLEVRDVGGRAALLHGELVALPTKERDALKASSSWRIRGFQDHSAAAERVFRSPMLARIARLIMGGPVRPIGSINFAHGSQQALHQDMAVFHIHPGNRLIGAWLALEDIDPRSGPLLFHPGSHRSPMFTEFDDYPRTNLRTADDARFDRYHDWVVEQSTSWPQARLLAKRGQVFFWHGMLIHGGSAIDQPGLSRRSMVVHYATPTGDRGSQITGPTRW